MRQRGLEAPDQHGPPPNIEERDGQTPEKSPCIGQGKIATIARRLKSHSHAANKTAHGPARHAQSGSISFLPVA